MKYMIKKKEKNIHSCLIPLILLRARFWRSKIRNSVSFWYVASSICLYALMCVRNFYHSIHVSNLDRYPSCFTHGWYNISTSPAVYWWICYQSHKCLSVFFIFSRHISKHVKLKLYMSLVSFDLTSILSICFLPRIVSKPYSFSCSIYNCKV